MKPDVIFSEVISLLPPFESLLWQTPCSIKAKAVEIRIRAGCPIIIETANERYVCGTRRADTSEIYNCIKCFCSYSIHSCQRELSEGWITLRGGHRAGFTGTAHTNNNSIETIKDISSVNLRIAKEHTGISDELFFRVTDASDFKGLIIAGAPLSGKTTMLRDFCRNLGNHFKTSLIDERGEIAAVYKGIPQNNIGINTDVLNYYPNNYGIEQAIRVLSPQFVVCDEAGGKTEGFAKCAASGVKLITSVHCGDVDELRRNTTVSSLVDMGLINYIVFLSNGKEIGKMKGLWFINDRKNLDVCNNDNNLLSYRKYNSGRSENAGYPTGKTDINA